MDIEDLTTALKHLRCERVPITVRKRQHLQVGSDHVLLLLVLRGHADLRIDQQLAFVQRGHCFVIQREQACSYKRRGSSEAEVLLIHIPLQLFQLGTLLEQDIRPAFFERAQQLRVSLNNRQTNEILERCDLFLDQRLDALTKSSGMLSDLHHLLGILLLVDAVWKEQLEPKIKVQHPMVRSALSYIEDNLTDSAINLQDCAVRIQCTPTYLSRVFREEVGRGFKDYILYKRTALAKHLLRNGASVTETCYNSGFSDYANFVKRFKQRCGMSPGRFRRDHLPLQNEM